MQWSKFVALVWVLTAALIATACSRPRPHTRDLPTNTKKTPESPIQRASLTARFEKAALVAQGISVDNLVYRFKYLTVATTGPIDFHGGDSAEVVIAPALPVGVKGTITLEVGQGADTKLKGEKADVTLAAGDNALEIELRPTGGAPANAKLKLTVKIGAPLPDPGELPASWDGRFFLGNARWQVEPIAG